MQRLYFLLSVCLLGKIVRESYAMATVDKDAKTPLCRGAFDLYFILDRSTSVSKSNFQVQTVNFIHNISGFFISPKLRISLISFATTATTDLELTGDRALIKNGMMSLKRKVPRGNTHLHLGLQLAIEQIERLGGMSASVIIVLTDGELLQYRKKAIDSAADARSLGATVYAVGVDDYKISDLKAIANSPAKDYVFTADNYASLRKLVASIVEKTCIEILSAEPSHICAGEKFMISLAGSGFTKTDNISKVICRFQLNSTNSHVTKPVSVTSTRLSCPAPVIENPENSVVLQVSVNGKTFVSSNVTVTALNCQVKVTQSRPVKNYGKIVLILFLVLLALFLLMLWWFWKLMPCAKPERNSPALIDSSSEPKKKKWATVDASFYGGGGVGGMKPVRVNWGEKGATESGNKLTKPQDAKVIAYADSECETVEKASCSSRMKLKFDAIGLAINNAYGRIASYRPIKNGNNKLYTSRSGNYEQARSALSSTSNQNA